MKKLLTHERLKRTHIENVQSFGNVVLYDIYRNTFKYVFIILLSLTFSNCDLSNNQQQNKHSEKTTQSFSNSTPVFLNYPDSGVVKKYFDKDWNIVHYKNGASYYRIADYVKGKPDSKKIVRDYYINGQIQFEGYLLDENPDILNGQTKWYYPSGQVESIRTYLNGKLNGSIINYYESGNLRQKTFYLEDNINGSLIEYYDIENKVKYKVKYSYNQPNGAYEEYFENGKLKIKGNFKSGLKEESFTYYYDNGNIKEKTKYQKDKLNGNYYSYFSNGTKETIGYYKDGESRGTWYYYDKDGDYKEYKYIDYRVGAICNDGWRSSATGRGACSHHGGVNYWLIETKKTFISGTGKYRNYSTRY